MLRTVASILGNPDYASSPYRDHSDAQLAALRGLGVNTVFANMAWSRPWLDAVILEHVAISPSYPWLSDPTQVTANVATLRQRVDAIARAGMRPFFLFGCPAQIDLRRIPAEAQAATEVLIGVHTSRIAPDLSVACIQSPEVRTLYRELLTQHFARFPETAGILFYTMDELAEVCDELDACPHCGGVPLHERLPGFLQYLYRVMQELSPGVEMWWEPWEFTATQTYAMVERLDPAIKISVHTSIHETYFVNQPDIWLRHLCRLAADRGIEVIADLFYSGTGEDLGPLPGFPCPRLVYEQLHSLSQLPPVTGVKEYYGTVAEHISVNERVLREFLSAPERDFHDILREFADGFGAAGASLLVAWEQAARAVETFPWDLSWPLRQYNSVRYDQTSRGKYWARGFISTLLTPWTTPSWESSRLAYYAISRSAAVVTERLLEETYQRFGRSAGYLDRALSSLDEAAGQAGQCALSPALQDEIARQVASVRIFRHLVLSRQYHLQASRLASQVRAGAPGERVRSLLACLAADLQNARDLYTLVESGGWLGFNLPGLQQTIDDMAGEIEACRRDPRLWVETHLLSPEAPVKK